MKLKADVNMQGRKVIGSLGCMMKGRTVNIEIKRTLYDSKIVPTLTYVRHGHGMKIKYRGSR